MAGAAVVSSGSHESDFENFFDNYSQSGACQKAPRHTLPSIAGVGGCQCAHLIQRCREQPHSRVCNDFGAAFSALRYAENAKIEADILDDRWAGFWLRDTGARVVRGPYIWDPAHLFLTLSWAITVPRNCWAFLIGSLGASLCELEEFGKPILTCRPGVPLNVSCKLPYVNLHLPLHTWTVIHFLQP